MTTTLFNKEMDSETQESLEKTGNIQPTRSKYKIHCLNIIGQIEGHEALPPQTKTTKYEHIIPQLVSVEEDLNIDGILVILNTVGGDIEAGLAISELINGMSKSSVSLVLGGSHSIGVPLSVCTNYSFIVPSATMTIHPVRMNGTIIGTPQTYNYFERVQDRVTNFVARNSKISDDEFTRLMHETGNMSDDIGIILYGVEAVNYGIIDSVGGIKEALSKLYELIEQHKS